jgi:hypothetical protein
VAGGAEEAAGAAEEETHEEEEKARSRQGRGRRARKAAQTQAEREAAALTEYMAQQAAYFAEVSFCSTVREDCAWFTHTRPAPSAPPQTRV